MRVLRIYHSAVVDEYRNRERLLRSRHGHDVHVVCPPEWLEGGKLVRAPVEADVPVHIATVNGLRRPNLFLYRGSTIRQIIRDLRPEIVDLHEEPFSAAAGGVLRAMRLEASSAKLCVYSAQNLGRRYPPPFSLIEQRVLATARAAYPCSTEAGDRLIARGFRGKVHVLPLGVTIPTRIAERAGPPRVGFIGRLEPYKGGLLAVRAFAAAAVVPDSTMEVIGAGSQEDELRAEVRAAGLENRVTFTGALTQEKVLGRMGGLDVVLVPSLTTHTWKEQFGRVPVQAMAHGAVVIASDSGSLREVVGDCGVLVREGDQAGLDRALTDLLQQPRQLEDLRRRGLLLAARRFSWEAVSDGVDAMYRGLVRA
jgi:glycosyltransferase involved in cell wall biosynthesis